MPLFYSFIFSEHFFLVRVMTELKPVTGTLRHEAGIHCGWDTSLSQDTIHTVYTVFLLCLVEVHDAMDDLHRWVATEERDLIWKLFRGRVRNFGGIDFLCFTAAAFLCWLRAPFLLTSIYKKCNFLKFSYYYLDSFWSYCWHVYYRCAFSDWIPI